MDKFVGYAHGGKKKKKTLSRTLSTSSPLKLEMSIFLAGNIDIVSYNASFSLSLQSESLEWRTFIGPSFFFPGMCLVLNLSSRHFFYKKLVLSSRCV